MPSLLELCCGEARRGDSHGEDVKAFSVFGQGPAQADDADLKLPSVDLFDDADGLARFIGREPSDRYTRIFFEEQTKALDAWEAEEKQQLMDLDERERLVDEELRAMVEKNRSLDEQVANLEAHAQGSEPLDLNLHESELARVSGFSHMTGFSNRDLDLLSSFLTSKPEESAQTSAQGVSLADPSSAFIHELQDSLADSDDECEAENTSLTSSAAAAAAAAAAPVDLLQSGVEACYRKDYTRAKRNLKKCARLAVLQQDEMLAARALANLANVYEITLRSAKALALYRTCIALLRKNEDLTRERFVVANALLSCVNMKKYEEAIEYGRRQLEILKATQALHSRRAEPQDVHDDIEQQIRDTSEVIAELESALADGYEVSFDLHAKDRSLYALKSTRSMYASE